MRIDPSYQYLNNTQPEGVGNTQGQPKVPSSQVSGGNSPAAQASESEDTVQFSGNLNQVQQLKTQLSSTPDVRANRVAALQQQVQQGTYKPSNEAIANAMVSDLFGASGQK